MRPIRALNLNKGENGVALPRGSTIVTVQRGKFTDARLIYLLPSEWSDLDDDVVMDNFQVLITDREAPTGWHYLGCSESNGDGSWWLAFANKPRLPLLPGQTP